MRYLPLTPADRRDMLATIGAGSIDDLFSDVPAAARLTKPIVWLLDSTSRLAFRLLEAGANTPTVLNDLARVVIQPGPEAAAGAADPLGDGADLAVVLGQQRDDPVGLAELVGAQDDGVVPVGARGVGGWLGHRFIFALTSRNRRHGPSAPRKQRCAAGESPTAQPQGGRAGAV